MAFHQTFICFIRLPWGTVPYMDKEFEILKRRINEPNLCYAFDPTTYGGDPYAFLPGASKERAKEVREKIKNIGRNQEQVKNISFDASFIKLFFNSIQ